MGDALSKIAVTDAGALKNALRKYTRGAKLTISQFNQAARLAWLGRVVLSPLDPADPECRAWLLHLERPEGLAGELLHIDEDLLGRIHVLDAEQGEHLVEILQEGVAARAGDLAELDAKDFYLQRFMRTDEA
jgi:hypothetical protein